jgi:hypothetical protein
MNFIFKTAAGIATMWSLAAFAIAGLLYLAPKRRGKVHPFTIFLACTIVLIVLVPTIGWIRLEQEKAKTVAIYEVRVTVLDPQSLPSDDAKVWSSMGGEPKKVAGGWQFDIPTSSKPNDGKLIVYAAVSTAFLTGQSQVLLMEDHHPNVTIKLARDQTATIRGIVTDSLGRSLSGARVNVVGYASEGVTTGEDGNFVLPAHAAEGQQVMLHAEKKGYQPISQGHPAGIHPAQIVFEK